jgi:hypothetical protein
MVSVTESILMDCPADEVFAFIGNYEHDPQWRAGVFEMQHDPPGKARVGTKTHEVMRFMGQKMVNHAVVVEYEMGHKTAFRTISSALSASGYRLVEQQGQQTRFTYHAQSELSGLYKWLSPFIVWTFRRRVKRDLKRLKEIVESTGKEGEKIDR